MSDLNFQTYISQANDLIKAAKTSIKALRGIGPLTTAQITAIAGSLGPVFTLLGQYRNYIPKL